MAVEGVATRSLALAVLARVEDGGAFATLALSGELERSGLDARDRALVTDLVNGTLRWQRYLDFVVGRYLADPPPPAARRALRLGAYQLLRRPDIPAYATVSATVAAAPKRFRGLVNAVLRKVAGNDAGREPVAPDRATALSYPDWLVDRLCEDLGSERAIAALAIMNEPPVTTVRDDGYVQDPSSQLVVAALRARPGDLVIDLCAAPGGKSTGIAGSGATVIACDLHPSRAALVRDNDIRVAAGRMPVVVADARRPPLRPGIADRVLLDAPCSGLGALRRRSDARWRMRADSVEALAELQWEMIDAAVGCLAPGGWLVYSVCTLTAAETLGVDARVESSHPELHPLEPPGSPWEPWGRGAILLPAAEHHGMCVFRYRLGSDQPGEAPPGRT